MYTKRLPSVAFCNNRKPHRSLRIFCCIWRYEVGQSMEHRVECMTEHHVIAFHLLCEKQQNYSVGLGKICTAERSLQTAKSTPKQRPQYGAEKFRNQPYLYIDSIVPYFATVLPSGLIGKGQPILITAYIGYYGEIERVYNLYYLQ